LYLRKIFLHHGHGDLIRFSRLAPDEDEELHACCFQSWWDGAAFVGERCLRTAKRASGSSGN
jgi:hypothetical protein